MKNKINIAGGGGTAKEYKADAGYKSGGGNGGVKLYSAEFEDFMKQIDKEKAEKLSLDFLDLIKKYVNSESEESTPRCIFDILFAISQTIVSVTFTTKNEDIQATTYVISSIAEHLFKEMRKYV